MLESDNQVIRRNNGIEQNSQSILKLTQRESPRTQNFASNSYQPEVLLSTAIIYTADKKGKLHEARALLDSGSQSNFMSRELSQRLRLNLEKVWVPIYGIGQGIIDITHYMYSRFNNAKFDSHFLIIDNITENLPAKTINLNHITIPKNIIVQNIKLGSLKNRVF